MILHLRIWWLSARLVAALVWALCMTAAEKQQRARANRALARTIELAADVEALEREVRDERA